MDNGWKASVHQALRATEANLSRLQGSLPASKPPYVGGSSGPQRPQAGLHNQPQQQSHHTTAVRGEGSDPGPHPFYQRDDVLRQAVRSFSAELDLERQVRDDVIKELSRRSTHEVAELRELIRQLQVENHDVRRSLTAVEKRLRAVTAHGSSDGGGATSDVGSPNAALAPRIAELERVTERLQRSAEDRMGKLEQLVRTEVRTQLDVELERARSVAREAARETTEALVRHRVEAIQQLFAQQLHTASDSYEKATQLATAVERRLHLQQVDHAEALSRLDQRVQAAWEAKEKWDRLESEIHDLVKQQLETERGRVDETLRVLRSEVASSARRQSQDITDAQHALQHFVTQRMESLQAQSTTKDEVLRIVQTQELKLDHELDSVKKLATAYKLQVDEARLDYSKQLQSLDGKWHELRVALDDAVAQRHSDQQASARLRTAMDDLVLKVKQSNERLEESLAKHGAFQTKLNQLHGAVQDSDRERKVSLESVNAAVEQLQRTQADQGALSSRHATAVAKLEQVAAGYRDEVDSVRELIAALQANLRELQSSWRKQVVQQLKEHEDTVMSKAMALLDESVEKMLADGIRRLREDLQRALQSQITQQLQDDMAKLVRTVDERLTAQSEQLSSRLSSGLEGAKRHADALNAVSKTEILDNVGTQIVAAADRVSREITLQQREALSKIKEDLQSDVDASAEEQRRRAEQLSTALRDVQFRLGEQGNASELALHRCVADVTATARAQFDEARALVDKLEERVKAKSSSLEESLSAKLQRVDDRIRQSVLGAAEDKRHSGESSSAASQLDEAALLQRTKQAILVEVDERLESLSQSFKKRLLDGTQSTAEAVASLRRQMNEIDERVTTLHVSSVTAQAVQQHLASTTATVAGVPTGAPRDAVDAAAITETLRLLVTEVEGRWHGRTAEIREKWISPLETSLAALSKAHHAIEDEVSDIKAQLADATSLTRSASGGVGRGRSGANGGEPEEMASTTAMAEVAATICRDALQALHVELNESFVALDDKVNALADTFSQMMQERDRAAEASARSCAALMLMRESSGEERGGGAGGKIAEASTSSSLYQHYHQHSTSSSSATTATAATNSAHLRPGAADSSSSEDESARWDTSRVLELMARRLLQSQEALQAVSSSVLDTVDLVQRHETGFASLNELVQAIMFNAQNIVTLAEAMGLEKHAFTLRLNYPEMDRLEEEPEE